MATLAEGQQYALTSHLNHSIDKSLIFVKLTDSALKAIEDYLNHKGSVCSNSKPSIEFRSNDSQGVISIPLKASDVSEERQRFSFTLSNVDAVEPQGSFECIRHTRHKSIESLGNIDYKLQIHANDDSYKKTRDKVAVVERESKKNSTKVIKASDPNVGRKVKVRRHLTPSRPAPHSQPAQASQAQTQPQTQTQTGQNGYKSYSPPSLKLNGNTINGIPNDKTSVSNNSISTAKSNSNAYLGLNSNLDTNQNQPKRSLRLFVVHQLALAPLKYSELLSKLAVENLVGERTSPYTTKDLQSVLNEVCTEKDKSDVCELSKVGWSEVQTDYSDYTNDERDLVIYRKSLPPPSSAGLMPPSGAKSPLSDCGSMRSLDSPMSVDTRSPLIGSKSPSVKRNVKSQPSVAKKRKPLNSGSNPRESANNDKTSETTKLKTNGYNHLLNGWANKPSSPDPTSRPTITAVTSVANLMNGFNNELKGSDSASPGSDFDPQYLSQTQQQFHNQTNSAVNYLANDNSFSKSQSRHAFNRYKHNSYRTANGSDSINSSPNSSPDSGTGSHDGSTLSSSNSYMCTNDDNPDYLSKYTKILSNEQRAQYKRDFYIEYEEYRRLHRNIENVATKFSELEIRLNTKVEGSDDWNKLMDQIVKEYEETKNCPKFQKCRKRMFYLHDKLAHIKGLVLDYDRNFHTNSNAKNRFSHNKPLVKSNPIS